MTEQPVPPHPYYCAECGQHAPFRAPFCVIPHAEGCSRAGENERDVYYEALWFVQQTGEDIP